MKLFCINLSCRILFLVIIGSTPAFVVTGYNTIAQKNRALEDAQTEAVNTVTFIAGEQSRLLTSTRQFLLGLSKLQVVRSPATSSTCIRTLEEINRSYPFYTNIGVAQLNGDMFCNSRPMPTKVNIIDRAYFQRAITTHDFGIGDYQVGRVTKRNSINLGFPVMDNLGTIYSVIFTAIDLDWLNQLISGVKLPEESEIIIVDNNGTVLAYYPAQDKMVGVNLAQEQVVSRMMTQRSPGTFETTGPDHIDRIYAYSPVRDVSGANIYVSVGLSKRVVFTAVNNSIRSTYLSILSALFVTLILVWLGSSVFILRRVKSLVATARELGSGNFNARTSLSHGKDEMGELARSFDVMAEAIQKLNDDLEDRVLLRTRQLEEALESQKQRTLLDPLTGLPNRLLFNDRLSQAIIKSDQDKSTLAVGFLDIDDFKNINDTYGHLGGDTVLRMVSKQLQIHLPTNSTVARIGGDEFALLITGNDKAEILKTIDSLDTIFTSPVDIGSRSFRIHTSMGLAFYPEHGRNLVECADVAMYAAKKGESGMVVYTKEIDHEHRNRVLLHGDISMALVKNQISLYLQPQFDYLTGQIAGVVGVARWEHPSLGIIRPLVFLPIIQNAGLEKLLTRTIIEQAARQINEWKTKEIELPISVKIDPESIIDSDLVIYTDLILKKYNIASQLLGFSIQESALLLNPTLAQTTIAKLQNMGVSITVEDFGTGYGSMGWISNTIKPLSKIKISRQYILGMSENQYHTTYIQSLINVAHALKLKVIADGVEDQTVWEELKTLGCDFALGYYQGRPLSPNEFIKWFKDLRTNNIS